MHVSTSGRRAKRRSLAAALLTACVTLIAGCGGAASSAASSYPTRSITILAPFAAGSTVDVEARQLARGLKQQLHQNVIVVDAPGGSGGVALTDLETKPADGYTLLLDTRTLIFLLASGKAHYGLKDIAAVARLSGEGGSLFVRSSSPFHTMKQFVAYAKAHPGKLTVAGPGSVAIEHMIELSVADAAGINVKWIPYQGGSKVIAAVLGGHVDGGFAAPSNALSNVKAGRLRYLGIAAKPPYAPLPNQPTFQQAGYPVVQYVWRGLITRAGVPQPILDRLASAVDAVRKSAAWKGFMKKEDQVDLYLNAKAFQTDLAKEVPQAKAMAKRMEKIATK